jgi:hypothetical protein
MTIANNKLKNKLMKFAFKTLAIFLFTTQIFAATEQIGVIGFVIGDVFNQKGEKLNVGDSIFFGDTISSSEGAKSQLMFIDQTVMTIGSKTELAIDEFIYDPVENTGKLLTTIKAGSVKILTGKISEINPENLEVKTPAGTIGTRGTEFKASVDPETTQSKILLVGPGPNNQLNLRPGSVEVSNAFGTVILDQPYLYTELTQNLSPTEAAIIPQAELKKFQTLEVEPQTPGSTESPGEEAETLLAKGELNEKEIQDIVKGEMFAEGEDVGSLVMNTLVAALAKGDGGITAQMLGKSFMSSGDQLRIGAGDLPEGMELNSPEALIFMEDKTRQELEKIMLVSARIKDVDYVPSKFNQFSGFDDIRVPILNEETGDVVFLDMENIYFKPQALPVGFDPNAGLSFRSRAPEQIFLKGKSDDDNVFINFDEGQFFEEVIDPKMEALDAKYMSAMETGASQEEMEAIFTEMDDVLQKTDEAMVAIDMGRMQADFMPIGVKLDIFTAAEFTKQQDAFLFDAGQYSESWDQAEEGKVAIFQMDGSIDFVNQKDAFKAREAVDKAYETDFAEAFPEIFRAEKKAEALMIQADAEADKLYAQMDTLLDAGGSADEMNSLMEKIDGQIASVYSEVDAAFQVVIFAEMKSDLLIVAEEVASLKSEIAEAKKTGTIDSKIISKDKIKATEKKLESLEIDIKKSKEEFIQEVRFASKVTPEIQKMEQDIQREIVEVKMYYDVRLPEPNYNYTEIEIDQNSVFTTGTTSYADLNQITSGTKTYYGASTDLKIVTAGSSANAAVDQVDEVAGSFKATHSINYSNRQITQGADITVSKLGRNTTSRTFSVSTDHTYTASTSGDVKPTAEYEVAGDDASNVVGSTASSLAGATSYTAADGSNDRFVEENTITETHYLVTVSADVQNNTQAKGISAAGTIQTTVTVESEQAKTGSNISNKASGTDGAVSAK